MASITGRLGSSATGNTDIREPVSLGVTCPTGVYPNTKIEFLNNGSGGTHSYWRNTHSGETVTAEIFLCDSSGKNKVKIFGLSMAGGQTNTTGKSETYTNSSKLLAGKALYIIATGTNTAYLRFRGQTDITITTSNASYTLSSARNPTAGGTVTLGASSGNYNTKIKVSTTVNIGYTFSSWSKSGGTLSSTTATVTTFTMPAANSTVTANYTHNTYSVGKAASPSAGGSVTLSASSGYYNDKVKITATANTGYTFSSWSKSSGTLQSTTATTTTFTLPAANSTVTANFTHNTYSVSTAVDPSGGGSVTLGASSGYYNDKINVTATANTGYTFSSWSKSSGTLSSTTTNPTTFTLPNSNSTVTATFTHNTYTLSSAVSPSGGGSVSLGKSTAYYNDKVKIIATASTGYTFSSWSKTGGTLDSTTATTTTFTMPNANATVTANFTHNTYSIASAISPAGGGTATFGANSGHYNDNVEIVATAATGYTFSSWSATAGTLKSATASTTTFTLPASNSTVTANFTHNTYTLSASASPQAGGTVYVSKSTCYYNDSVSISATPATGYQFSQWSATAGTIDDSSASSTTFTMPASNASLTATFSKINYSVTTGVSPSGSGTLTASPSTAQMGDTVTLSPVAATGYELDSYTTNPQVTITNNTFTMPASNVSITANFVQTIWPSTCTLDKFSYNGGDVAVLTITACSNTFTHKYKLDFLDGMSTGWVNVAAGVSTVNIYVPVEWAMLLTSDTSKTGGVLTLNTYDGATSVGTTSITGLTYNALGNTIPTLSVWRCNSSGTSLIDGVNGKYSLAVPQGLSSYKLIYGQDYVSSPSGTGDLLPGNKKNFPIADNQMIELQMTFSPGSSLPDETFSIFRDLPKVVIVKKKC